MSPTFLPLIPAIPLITVGVSVVTRHKWLDRLLMIAVPLFSIICGALLLWQHQNERAIAHSVGDYLGGIAIMFVSDTLTALLLVVTGLVTLAASVYLIITEEDQLRFAPALVLMLSAGVNGALTTGDLFNFFVFIEVMLLPSYALIAITGTWRRLGVGRMFLLVNITASTILVMGIGLVYAVTGTVNIATLAGIAGQHNPTALAMGVVLFAMVAKAGLVPVHSWLPRAYPATSAGMMALFSALHTKIGVYAIYRFYTVIYGDSNKLGTLLMVLVVVTVITASLCTFAEKRIRGALAFQMVAGIGQIMIGLVVLTQFSLAAGLFYMVHHMITMAALIMCSGAVETTYGSGRFDRIHGLMRREPLLSTIVALGLFSLIGLPPTSGLWGKVLLLGSTAQADPVIAGTLIGTVVVGSIMSMLALQRLWRRVFFGAPMREYLPDDPITSRGELTPITEDTKIPSRTLMPALGLVSVSVLLFIFVGAVWPVFDAAGAALIDPTAYVSAVFGE